jgi:hypothetical protein
MLSSPGIIQIKGEFGVKRDLWAGFVCSSSTSDQIDVVVIVVVVVVVVDIQNFFLL